MADIPLDGTDMPLDVQRVFRMALVHLLGADIDENYDDRNTLTYSCMSMARSYGIPCGIRFDPDEPEWPVFFFCFPEGQVAFHVQNTPVPYDGHTKEEARDRLRAVIRRLNDGSD